MVKVKGLESVRFSRYLCLYHVLRTCNIRAIPTYAHRSSLYPYLYGYWRKLVVSTCRYIAYVERTLDKQQKKLQTLEEQVSLGTVSKDLLLPKKKVLLEDEQSKVDETLHIQHANLYSNIGP